MLLVVFVVALVVVVGGLSSVPSKGPVVSPEEVSSSGGGVAMLFGRLLGFSKSLPNNSGLTLFLVSIPLRRCAAEVAAVAN